MKAIATLLATLMLTAGSFAQITPGLPTGSLGSSDLVDVTLVADAGAVALGRPFTVGVLLKLKPGWHVYWRNPGDSGLATEVAFALPEGYKVGPLVWPRPETSVLPGDIVMYGYADEVLLAATVTPPAQGQAVGEVPISAQVRWLACKDACISGSAKAQLTLEVVADAKDAIPENADLFKAWARRSDPPAPPLSLNDQDGKAVSLADFKGKVVVLEWINPDCPFVKRHHVSDSTMVDLEKKFGSQGVVWLAVNSTHYMDAAASKKTREQWNLPYPILIDTDGKAGRSWGAKTTPHMFVISPEGRIVYQGAIDDDPRGRKDEKLNYVEQALTQLLARKPVSEPQTKPYGCSVKYAPDE